MTYNEPKGTFTFDPSKPILLDFYLTHCLLSPKGYKVRLSIDETFTMLLTKWVAYHIHGLEKGMHHITLELLDQENQLVSGNLNYIKKKIIIK